MEVSQLLKGVLDLAVIAVLIEEDGYGYDVVRRLRDGGIGDVGDASVYGTLRRLFKAGLLTSYVVPSDEGPHRKYYGVNERGRQWFLDSSVTWNSFRSSLDGLVKTADGALGNTPDQPMTQPGARS